MTFFVQVDGLKWSFSNFPDEAMPRPDTDGVLNIRSLCTVRSVAQRRCPGVYCTVAQRGKSFESAASSEEHSFMSGLSRIERVCHTCLHRAY